MKLKCDCGQDYLYDHKKAGQQFECPWCKKLLVIPQFKELSPEDQACYRTELEKKQKKEERAANDEERKKQLAAKKEAATRNGTNHLFRGKVAIIVSLSAGILFVVLIAYGF